MWLATVKKVKRQPTTTELLELWFEYTGEPERFVRYGETEDQRVRRLASLLG